MFLKSVMKICVKFIKQMNERSSSLPRLPSEVSVKRQNSIRYIAPRLNFPKQGDSSIFSNAGRKHFQNHSDRMLKIILPEKFASEKPINFKKDIAYPPPHLIRHSSQRAYDVNQNASKQAGLVQKIFARNLSLRDKIEDELDKMKKSMEIHKKISPKIVSEDVGQTKHMLQLKTEVSNSPQLSPLYSVSSTISSRKESSPIYNSSKLLYNPENKEKYDAILKGRWLSPTNLSTGLSII